MAWNNGYPATYGQMYPQMPQNYPQSYQPIPNGQLTPPTIRAEIVQVENEAAAANFPVGAGASQMMIARDESAIFIKSALANGQTALDVYEKRAPAAPAPVFDPGEYVRKDEIETLVSEAVAAQMKAKEPVQPIKRTVKKEET